MASISEEIIRQNEINQWVSQKETLENNINKEYNLVWGQYSDGLKYKLDNLNDYATIQKYFNIFELIKHIKTIILKNE